MQTIMPLHIERVKYMLYDIIRHPDIISKIIVEAQEHASINGWQLAKMKKSIPNMSLP